MKLSIAVMPQRLRTALTSKYALPAVFALVLVGGFGAWRLWAGASQFAARSATSAAIEERWGIRITQIGVIADGGLLDFRFIVVDPDKALAMLDDPKNLPALIAEDSHAVVTSAALMAHKNALNAGRTYFLLYRNTGGAIKRGTSVSVVIGDLRLEHIVAK